VGLFHLWQTKQRNTLVLFGSVIAVIGAFAITGKILYPRYVLFIVPLLLVLAGYGLKTMISKESNTIVILLTAVMLIVGSLQSLRFQSLVMQAPWLAHYPSPDYDQLLAESPSGLALKPFYPIIDQALAKGPVELVTDGTFGLLPYAFTLRYWGNPSVKITPIYPFTTQIATSAGTTQFMVVKSQTNLEEPLQVVSNGLDSDGEVEYRLFVRASH
jgi:hypothetical protein